MTLSPNSARVLRFALVGMLATALVTACGFRPRGNISLPEDVRTVHVDGPVAIADEVALFLDEDDVSVVGAAGEADVVIRLLSERYDQRVAAVDATTGKAREFELVYVLDYSVRRKDGTMVIGPEQIVVRRVYVFDPTAVIGATENVEVLQRDMREDAAERIIRAMEAALGS